MPRDVNINFKGDAKDLEQASDRASKAVKGAADDVENSGRKMGSSVGGALGTIGDHADAAGLAMSGMGSVMDGLDDGNLMDIVQGLGDLARGAVEAGDALGGKVMEGVGKLRDGLSGLTGRFKQAADAGDDMLGTTSKLGASISTLGPALIVAGAAVAAGTIAWQRYSQTKAEAKRITDEMVEALKKERDGVAGASDAVIRKELADSKAAKTVKDHAANIDVLIEGLKSQGRAIEVLDNKQGLLASSTNKSNVGMKTAEEVLRAAGVQQTAFTDELVRLIDKTGLSSQAQGDLINTLDGLSDRYDDGTKKLELQTTIMGTNTAATDTATTAFENQTYAADRLASSIAGVTDALKDQVDDIYSVQAAADALTAADEALTTAVDKNGQSFEGNSKAARDNRAAWRDVVDASVGVIKAHEDAGDSADQLAKVAADLEAHIRSEGEAFGVQTDQINAAADALETYRLRALAIAGKIVPNFVPPAIPGLPGTEGYASGTTNATAGVHLVGEAGPELAFFRGGETVLNASDTAKALGGTGDVNVTVINHIGSVDSAARINQLSNVSAESIKRQLQVLLR